jgi:hypothetical protein
MAIITPVTRPQMASPVRIPPATTNALRTRGRWMKDLTVETVDEIGSEDGVAAVTKAGRGSEETAR